LVDAFHVPKLLSQQLLPFGRSGDGLGVLTFGVEQFSVLFVPGGRSARAWPTVREGLADGPRAQCPSRVRRVLGRLCFRSDFALGFHCSRFADGPSFSSGRSGTRADGPPVLRGRSVFLGSVLVVLLFLTDGPWPSAGRSACPLRTVRGTWPDCPRGLCGQSVLPGRTVRPRVTAWFLVSIPSFFFRTSACASRNRS
jgi:hypothetical protein